MKKIKFSALILLLQITFFSILGFSFISNHNDDEIWYYVVVAHESGHDRRGQPVVSNVVFANCKGHSGLMVSNQFNTYYVANYSASRNHKGLMALKTFGYYTRELAEAKRKEIIADLNRKWSPLLTSYFSVVCED